MISSVAENSAGPPAKRYRFGDCTLDTGRHALTRAGESVPVEPKVFDLLRLVVENAGQLISRDRLIDEIWQGRIVSDSAISACIAAARRAVGDDGQTQAIIRTVPRRGIICVASVEVEVAATAPALTQLPPRLHFTKNRDQQTIAYATSGSGPPIIYTTFSGTSIEADWSSPFFRPLFDALGAQNTLVRFDEVGTGNSDLELKRTGVEAEAYDLLAVADAAGLDRFGLFCQSGSALSAIYIAAHYPERVTRMVLNGGYAEGRSLRQSTSGTQEMLGIISEAWDKPDSGFLPAYALLYFPEGPLDLARDIVEIMQRSCPEENMLRLRQMANEASVVDLLDRVRCPTLIVHARDDGIHPISQARQLAAGISNSELLVLESANHVPMPGSADWDAFLNATIRFLNGA